MQSFEKPRVAKALADCAAAFVKGVSDAQKAGAEPTVTEPFSIRVDTIDVLDRDVHGPDEDEFTGRFHAAGFNTAGKMALRPLYVDPDGNHERDEHRLTWLVEVRNVKADKTWPLANYTRAFIALRDAPCGPQDEDGGLAYAALYQTVLDAVAHVRNMSMDERWKTACGVVRGARYDNPNITPAEFLKLASRLIESLPADAVIDDLDYEQPSDCMPPAAT